MAKDLGVKILANTLERGEDFESPKLVISDVDNPSPYLDDTCIGSLGHGDNINLVRRIPKKRPKWWHNTIRDVQVGEMIEGWLSEDDK